MERIRKTPGSSRRRIIESDSESEVDDDVNELSMSMKHVQLKDEHDTESNTGDILQDSESEEENVVRKPPRGRNKQTLDDFSWSSSDDESEGSCWSSSSSTRNEQKKSAQEEQPSESNLPSVSSRKLASQKKASQQNTSFTPSEKRSVRPNLKSRDSDLSLSDSSLSILSDSDDDLSIMSADSKKKTSKERKKFSWSFNKNQKVYTLGGNDKLPAFSIPSDLYDQLYDFQKEGVGWMASLHKNKIGGILGDDMGMGKTYTTLAFLGGLMKAKTIKKAVVVAPVSVLRNWENEANKILRQCVAVKIQVISSDVSVYNRKKRLHQALEAQSAQLVITSYGLVAKNPEFFTQHVVGKHVWDYVILDEAHTVKNPTTQNNQAVHSIAQNGRTRRLMLTGTPIMNHLKDLHTLFDFATSGRILGSHKEFLNQFGKPIEAARSADATDNEVEDGELAMQELQELIQPYFLQRMKSEYLAECLPSKHEYVLWTNLSPLQRDLYMRYIESETVSAIVGGEAKSPLFAISWLTKLCGHPLLVETETVETMDNFDDHDPYELMRTSQKLGVMYNLVNALISNGHRTLIFSQFTTVLDIIERVLKEEFKLSRIDGQTRGKDRQKLVDEFNDPESEVDIMLISTKAGGQGLTLTGADSCIVYDPSWNPAEDAQAVDRCYRLGQKKEVQVYRLITAGTVEEKRYEKQIHKDGIRRTVLTNTGNNTAKYFTKEELSKRVFILGVEGECEFLDKLETKGFIFKKREFPEHSHSSLEGVIGQSSHDIVYSLPDNFYFDEEELLSPAKSPQPFSSPPVQAEWHSTTTKMKITSNSKPITSKKSPQPFSSPPVEAQWFREKTEMIVTGRSEAVDNKENRGDNEKSTSGRIKIVGDASNEKLRDSIDSQSDASSSLLENSLSKVKNLRTSGRKEQAVGVLMDLLDDARADLNEDEVSKVHNEMATITNELGWLEIKK